MQGRTAKTYAEPKRLFVTPLAADEICSWTIIFAFFLPGGIGIIAVPVITHFTILDTVGSGIVKSVHWSGLKHLSTFWLGRTCLVDTL
jgi:hypothetical protein